LTPWHTCLDSCALRMLHRVQYASWLKNSCVAQSFFFFSLFLAKSHQKATRLLFFFFFFFFSLNGVFCRNKFPLFRKKFAWNNVFFLGWLYNTVCQDFKYLHNLYKGYFMGKVAQIRQIFEEFFSKSLDFYNKFQ
jgi:hypothetical protein